MKSWCRTIVSLLPLLMAAAPLAAQSPATVRLVTCGDTDCLLLRGHRASRDMPIEINGRAVEVRGARNFEVRLPVATVREWSAPYARTLRVLVAGRSEAVRLPVGVLGGKVELAALVVRAR